LLFNQLLIINSLFQCRLSGNDRRHTELFIWCAVREFIRRTVTGTQRSLSSCFSGRLWRACDCRVVWYQISCSLLYNPHHIFSTSFSEVHILWEIFRGPGKLKFAGVLLRLEGNLALCIFNSPRCFEFGCQYQWSLLLICCASWRWTLFTPLTLCLLASKVERCRYCSRVFTRRWRQRDDVGFVRRELCRCNIIITRTGTRQLSASSTNSWSSPLKPHRNI